jgi:HEAT repeat protein
MILLLLLLPARDEVTDQIAKLRAAADDVGRYRAVSALNGAVKPAHVPILVREVEAGPPAVRPHLIRVLAAIDHKDVPAALRTFALKHEVASRAEAAYHLAQTGEPQGTQILAALLAKAEADDDKRAVLSHLWGLFSEGGEVSAALSAFLDREKKEELRKLAIRALAYQKDASVLPALRKIAAKADDPSRSEAIAELVRRGDDEAMDQAFELLEAVKGGFASLYTLLNAIERANSKAALPRLRKLLEETPDQGLRAELIRTLADLKDDKSLAAIAKLTGDMDPAVARAATEAIIKLSGKGQLDLLKKAAGESQGTGRVEACAALLQLDRPEGFEGLKAELESGNVSSRYWVLQALSKIHRKESVDLLLPLLDASEEPVRQQSRRAVLQSLESLFPYVRFNPDAPADKLRAWWTKNRPK